MICEVTKSRHRKKGLSTLGIRSIELNMRNRIEGAKPKLVQTIAPSIPFFVFNPLYPQVTLNTYLRSHRLFVVMNVGFTCDLCCKFIKQIDENVIWC